jgi:hypothetical protein
LSGRNRLIFLPKAESNGPFLVPGHAHWGTPKGGVWPYQEWASSQGWSAPPTSELTLVFTLPEGAPHWAASPLAQLLAAWEGGAPLDQIPWVFFGLPRADLLCGLAAVLAAGGLMHMRLNEDWSRLVRSNLTGNFAEWAALHERLYCAGSSPAEGVAVAVEGVRASFPGKSPLPAFTSCGGQFCTVPDPEDPAAVAVVPFLGSWAVCLGSDGAPLGVRRRGPLSWGPALANALNEGRWSVLPGGWAKPEDAKAQAALDNLFAFLGGSLQGK